MRRQHEADGSEAKKHGAVKLRLSESLANLRQRLNQAIPWWPIVHIEDISRAFIAAIGAPANGVWNEAFNVGQTDHNYRIRDLAEIVPEVVPGCRIEFAADAPPDKRSYRVSFEKIRRKLPAFNPRWDAGRGAEQLYKAYQSSGLTLEEFEGPRHQRIAHIKKLLADGVLNPNLRYPQSLRNDNVSFAMSLKL
jgi:hypothetical protein